MRNSILFVLFASFALAGCSESEPASEPDPEPISETHQGRLEEGDPLIPDDNSLYDAYSFRAAEGMTITATMVSTEFDTYLILVDEDGKMLTHNDDDATLGEGVDGIPTNSKVTFVAPSTGTYAIYANALHAGLTGAYTLTITTTKN